MSEDFNNIIDSVKAQYLPEGSIGLLEKKDLKHHTYSKLLDLPKTPKQVVIKKVNELMLIAEISAMLFVELKSSSKTCNVGILKNLAHKINHEIRSTFKESG